jgi:hypothetical protein
MVNKFKKGCIHAKKRCGGGWNRRMRQNEASKEKPYAHGGGRSFVSSSSCMAPAGTTASWKTTWCLKDVDYV